jgi:hypothetical protein
MPLLILTPASIPQGSSNCIGKDGRQRGAHPAPRPATPAEQVDLVNLLDPISYDDRLKRRLTRQYAGISLAGKVPFPA